MELENLPVKNDGFLLPFARKLSPNEKVLMLVEEDRLTANLMRHHRWQIIYVGRGNQVYEFPRDLGPSENYKDVGGFILLSDGEDTVAEMLDLADEERDKNLIKAVLDEVADKSTLIKDSIDLLEQKRELVKRNTRTLRRDFGLPTVERNIY